MPELRQEYLDILEKREWSVSSYTDDGRVEIEWYSPAGEDFIICVGVEKFPDEVLDYSDSFDPDEHIAMWIEAKQSGTQGVPGARQPTYLTFKRRGGTWRFAGRCFEGSAEPVQKYQSSLEKMMLTRCKLLGVVAQEVEA